MECISCGKDDPENVIFPCPKCGSTIARCTKCKKLSTEYKCQNCGHEGP